jgi:hypothetical protein
VYDEIRVSNLARSPAWIAAEFANQSSPPTFYSVGTQQSGGSGPVTITVASFPSGLSLSVDGSPCIAPCNEPWVPGTSHVIAVTSTPQSGGVGTQYAYASWSDSGAQSHSITVPASAATYTASFTTQYYLATSAGTGGTISPASNWYTSGAIVSVSATANTGYTFSGFSGSLTGTTTPQNLTMNAARSITATFTSDGGSLNGYSYRRAITIDHTKVPNSDQVDFPVLISGAYSYLATIGNGGSVTNTNGYDIIFTSDQAGSSLLPFERETYTSSGNVTYWVKVPIVSHSADTIIYMFYGNPSVTTDPSNKTGVWDSNYKMVYHMADNAANATVADSSANANNAIDTANSNSKSVPAQVGAGLVFAGASGDAGASTSPITLGSTATFSTWFKAGSFSSYARLLETSFANSYYLGMNAAATKFYWIVNGGSGKGCGDSFGAACTSTTLTTGTWYYIAGTFDGATARIYLNGTLQGTDNPTAPSSQSKTLYLNRYQAGGYREDGVYDEIRVSNLARSPAWIAAEFANQSSPATFYSVGLPQ